MPKQWELSKEERQAIWDSTATITMGNYAVAVALAAQRKLVQWLEQELQNTKWSGLLISELWLNLKQRMEEQDVEAQRLGKV